MCLPPDVIPSLHCKVKVRDTNTIRWAVDQRPFVWSAAPKLVEKPQGPQGPVWTSWTEAFYPEAPPLEISLPSEKAAGGSDEPLGADSFLTLGSNLLTTAPSEQKDLQIYQRKVWEPPMPNGLEAAAPTTGPFVGLPPSCAASGVEMVQRSMSMEGSVLSCTSSPGISMAVLHDNALSTTVSDSVDLWVSPTSEEMPRRSSMVEELADQDQMQNANGGHKRKYNSRSKCTDKVSGITQVAQLKPRRCNYGSAALKTEIASRSKDMSLSESQSDNEDPLDDAEGGDPGVSEKRRKRMLSNRASAQRSRHRRQERLDTLEVLVAELRVENAALTRKATNAISTAKKFEEENKLLQSRLVKQELGPISESNASNESDKTTQSSGVNDHNRNGAPFRAPLEPPRNSAHSLNLGTHHDGYPRENGGPSKSDGGAEPLQDPQNPKRWSSNISSSSFDFDFDFSAEPADSAVVPCRAASGRPPDKMVCQIPENAGGQNEKDMYQSAHAFRGLDPFGIDLDQCNQEMDKKSLDSRSVEEFWLEGLANCLK